MTLSIVIAIMSIISCIISAFVLHKVYSIKIPDTYTHIFEGNNYYKAFTLNEEIIDGYFTQGDNFFVIEPLNEDHNFQRDRTIIYVHVWVGTGQTHILPYIIAEVGEGGTIPVPKYLLEAEFEYKYIVSELPEIEDKEQ